MPALTCSQSFIALFGLKFHVCFTSDCCRPRSSPEAPANPRRLRLFITPARRGVPPLEVSRDSFFTTTLRREAGAFWVNVLVCWCVSFRTTHSSVPGKTEAPSCGTRHVGRGPKGGATGRKKRAAVHADPSEHVSENSGGHGAAAADVEADMLLPLVH